MSDIVERAKAHLQAQERRVIKVPEWGADGKPLVITFTALTVAERRKIYKRMSDGSDADGSAIMVRAVILKACGEDGSKLFDEMHEHAMTYEVSADIVGRIANAILSSGLGKAKTVTEAVDNEKKA